MKKMTSSSETSISEIRLISGSSLALRVCILMRVRATPPSASPACGVGAQRVGELHRDLLHVDDDALDLAAQVAIRDVTTESPP